MDTCYPPRQTRSDLARSRKKFNPIPLRDEKKRGEKRVKGRKKREKKRGKEIEGGEKEEG